MFKGSLAALPDSANDVTLQEGMDLDVLHGR